VTYNGEIYNFIELRAELQALGHAFRSESDTEVLLAAYRQWGIDCLKKLNGMFAFALWDREQRELICARDRLGEKPLYYFWDGQCFAFASELKGLLPVVRNPVPNQAVVYAYLDGGRLDFNDQTFVEQIKQLEPAHFLRIHGGKLHIRRYWEFSTVVSNESMPADAVHDHFRMLFSDAVRIRLRSDVAVGSCLSGGLDSSAIVCVVNDLLARVNDSAVHVIGNKPKTFSACFDECPFDERRFMHEVVRSRAIDAHYTFPDPKELAEVMDRLVWQHDEPFGSTSSFAQWTVMRLASECGTKVLLDGQGADELLGGYHAFFGAYFADLVRAGRWTRLLHEARIYRWRHGAIPAQAFGNLGRGVLPYSIVHAVRRVWSGNRKWMHREFAHRWRSVEPPDGQEGSALLGMQQRLLTRNGLRALLHSEDRNSMAFGVEARLPFLDYRLVEFLYRLDGSWKLRDGWTKVLLREAMEGILPPSVQWRVDKIGFAAPEDQWFRRELRTTIEDCLADSRTKARGYLDIAGARRALHAHLSGRTAIGSTLWRWLNTELWCRRFLDHRPCSAS
jgi:asparagine synthase (glutamine-hydrolysing)